MIVDATDLILGRMATFVAKQSLLGERIDIINCEKAVISGDKQEVFTKYKRRKMRTTVAHGPFFPRNADRLVRRTIRGMLPYKQDKGRKAFERVMCHIDVPEEFEGKKTETIKKANINNTHITKYVKIAILCRELGAKQWK